MILSFKDLELFLQTCRYDHVKLRLSCEAENMAISCGFFNVFHFIFFFDESL